MLAASFLLVLSMLYLGESPLSVDGTIGMVSLSIAFLYAACLRVDRQALYSPATWMAAAFTLIFVLRPIYDRVYPENLAQGQFGHDPAPTLARALLLAAIGWCAWCVGYLGCQVSAATDTDVQESRQEPPPDGVVKRAALVATLSLFGFALYIATSGGPALLRQYFVGRTSNLQEALHGTVAYLTLAPIGCVGPAVLLLTHRLSARQRGLVAGMITLALFPFMGPGDRSVILPIIMSCGLAWWSWGSRRVSKLVAVIVSCTLLLALVSLPRIWRQDTVEQARAVAQLEDQGELQGLASGFIGGADTAMVNTFSVLIQAVPSELPYRYGRTYLEALGRPVPRAIWPQKPGSADQTLNQILFPRTAAQGVGFSFSILGEPFYNGGLAGVIVILGLLGALYGRLSRWCQTRQRDNLSLALISAMLPFLYVFTRGGIGVDYQRALFVVLPMLYVARGHYPRTSR
ncbi:MAG: oligosaccharide repeat unit polymerase [Coriobacteriales bacterium]|nr:oligosaccharide repeat unit polymerase [Coriobacteriales bacterium]